MAGALEVVDAMLGGDQPGAIVAVNPEKVMKARDDATLLAQLRSARLLIPDGIGIVWAARLLGLGELERVAGADLMPAICRLCAERGRSVFLFGAAPAVNQRACEVLRERYPGLRIAGAAHGYVSEDETPSLLGRINDSGADALFVALGSPRQEHWLARHAPELRVPVCQGVGGTFDVLAGNVPRAPSIVRNANLEWLYRLVLQPTRLPRHKALPRFAWQVLTTRFARDRQASTG
jgi:N-acetylglucosaminyldiphosphoundecaprenol N-acetyl-beta-D-mannosaminyltransferase